ncbi:hypothetical protein PAXRUDRAFT_85206, partial [Paxillus rubicundulus Ve08.2h10]
GMGEFQTLNGRCERGKASMEMKKIETDPLNFYKDYCFAGQPPTPFIQLAQCVLSVTANSASCEWFFSTFSSTLTKPCNWLGTNTLQALTEMKMHIWDQQLQQSLKQHVRRWLAEQ